MSVGRKGFTLVEVIVALVIIGISTAVILPNLTNSIEQTKAQAADNNLLAIAAAQEKFSEDQSNTGNPNPYCIKTIAPPTGATLLCGDSQADLNTNLHLSLSDPTFTYSCDSTVAPYECIATDGTDTLTLSVNPATMAASVTCTPAGGGCPF